ncbi:multifunctional 2',3'-cyclic-nucleotide 2'-phosphodiesterase/3'-nucleotidase/5'-nucleotidase [Bacillus paralicheniformis]|uniref:multifunctional 2',3'-cyclic-nucleotide 2'-phosphodiesterase/3'-nucleotidase/5'-nucleotidase n=1 Tax=Bacillus TaxID=1386 RepID=UPI001FBA8DDE|nr:MULTISPECIES: multifunctional 2',3'-cyclic-nucleotide 2'-phosphodiesterase/3'-nucleotidase/5'-nucleotidase [unclassified Bacillus (in: firmicutes)]MCJ2148354.1 multifunctional 2',3'-cyclic-nucleotide 2'-phosphodiesterase/3'-nucleotidase/5'-nucleotidase [Bacillus sp. B19-2]MDN5389899.1 multifunctional 2',3'-cyclic-nucleotide 2'-phosphodiesterase/3'-nucleotidase/5'-nucleotidase [Bacillus sp. LB7]
MVGIQKRRFSRKNILRILLTSVMILSLLIPNTKTYAEEPNEHPLINLSILGTTDIHAHIMDYDYYADKETAEFGLARTAQLIEKHRSRNPNTILVDNGDLIQGNPLGEYIFKHEREAIISGTKTHPIIDVMNKLHYDAGTLGNHEFNYGLEFLDGTIKGAEFPIVNANIKTPDGKNKYTPYHIEERTLTDESGQKHQLKVGYIGFVPPQILTWDKKHLDGKITVQDITESAKETIPKMKQEGADVIIAIAHSGIENGEQAAGAENAVYDLALKTEGIDAIISGHQHGLFPGTDYPGNGVIDNQKGTINGIPVVMPKNWGSHLGIIDMQLEQDGGKWTVKDASAKTEAIAGNVTSRHETVVSAIKDTHEKTLEYVRAPVGQTEADINSFFAQVKDDPSIQIVTDAQKWYAEDVMKGTEYENLPILSAGAPFKAGGRNGADYYTNIKAGNLAIKNIGDLYLYDNTLYIVKLTGSEVKDWIEMSAGQFNQIDPSKSGEQALLNPDFRSYNFDVIDGVTYQIDVTQPAKYNASGGVKNPQTNRVKQLSYNGKPVRDDQEFLVVTNNYRASGGGGFPHLTQDKVVYAAADENRQVLMNYIMEKKTVNPAADNNWSIAPIKGADVTFESSLLAKPFAEKAKDIDFVRESENSGYGVYKLNFEGSEPPVDDGNWTLTVMHTNDTHAHLDEAARRAAKVKEIRSEAENNVLLDAGDVFSGDLYFTKWNGLADLKLMNMMGYDAMTFGNHEFDKGPKVLADFLSGNNAAVDPLNRHQLEKPDFPIVSSNVDVSKEPQLRSFQKEPALLTAGEKKESGIYPYILLDVNGEQVGVFGLTTEDTSYTSSPGPNIAFHDAYLSAEKTVKELKEKEKVNKIIALTHLGYNRDLELAKKVKGIDLIIGGHTHTLVDHLKVVESEEPTIVAQVKDYGQFLGRVDVVFDEKGVVQTDQSRFNLIAIDGKVDEDPPAKEVLDGFKEDIDELKKKKVGYADVPLDGKREHVRSKETNLGNFIADGMLKKAKQAGGADIAITNGGGIRSGIAKGDITLGDVLTVMPFGNTLYAADLTGAQIKEALEHGVSQVEEGGGAFPHVAGLSFTFTLSKPKGERILDVNLVNDKGDAVPLDLDKTYRVATNNFMGGGGDGYSVFKEAKNGVDLGFTDYDIFTEQLASYDSVSPNIENRITEVFLPDRQTDGTWTLAEKPFETYAKNANQVIAYFPDTEKDHIKLNMTKAQTDLVKERTDDPNITLKNDRIAMQLPAVNLASEKTKISIKIAKNIKQAVTKVYDFNIQQNGKTVSTFKEPVGLFFQVDAPDKHLSVYYVDRKNNSFTKVTNGYTKGRTVAGYVDHFSEYTVMNDNDAGSPSLPPGSGDDDGPDGGSGGEPPASPGAGSGGDGSGGHDSGGSDDGNEPSDGSNGGILPDTASNAYHWLMLGLLLLIAGSGLYLYQRKRRKLQI